jgi:cytochrome c5
METKMNQLKKLSVFGAALLLVAGMAGCGSEEQEVQLTAQQEKDMSERLAPAGEVVLAGNVPEPTKVASAGPRSGEDIYNSKCVACHSSGVGGAPKTGVASDWSPRIDQGMDVLYANAINGIRGMPAKGLCMDCSDDEVKAAVDYILEKSK